MLLDPLSGGYAAGFRNDREYRWLRRGGAEPTTYRLCDQGPYFNIAGLYFATTGATDER